MHAIARFAVVQSPSSGVVSTLSVDSRDLHYVERELKISPLC